MLPRSVKRVLMAVLVALLVVNVAMVVVPDGCSALDPNSWLYWLLGCGKDAGGGGGSGAGL